MGFGHKIKKRSRKSVFNINKGRAESFLSLQPIQVEISMLGTDPNIPVEIKYLSLGLETCPNLRCHNKKRGVEKTTPEKVNEVSQKESLPTLRSFPINPLLHKASRMILYKTGGRREVNISIFFFKPERRFTENRKMKKSRAYSMITRESTKTS